MERLVDKAKTMALAGLVLGLGLIAWARIDPMPAPGQAIGQASATEEGVAQALAARRATLEAALAEAAPEARPAILAELALVRRGLADPRAALAAAEDLRGKLAAAGDLYAGTAAAEAIAAAAAAAAAGDPATAQAALTDALVQAEAEVSRAARLAHAAGQLAAARGLTLDAARAYVRAAALEPSYANLLAAERWARLAGDLNTAQSYAVPLVSAAVATFGQGSAAHGEALAAIAQTYVAANRVAEAEPLMREAIAISEGPQGARDAEYSQRLNNLGVVLRALGRMAEAERLFRQAVEVDRAVLGERHPDVPARLANLAELLAATGRAAEAEGFFRQSAEIARQVLGADSAETAARQAALAAFLIQTGGDAGPALSEAEASLRAAFAGQPELAGQLASLSDLVKAASDSAGAERLLREALALIEVAPGKTHADYGRVLNNLGRLMADLGRPEEAREAYREALAILSASLGAGSEEAKTVAANLASLPPG